MDKKEFATRADKVISDIISEGIYYLPLNERLKIVSELWKEFHNDR